MESSDSTIVSSDAPSQQHVLTRAILSAAVFGAIGSIVGRWLGKRGNDRETYFAETVMSWSMGLFSGLLAAYCSFKASEHGTNEATQIARDKNDETLAPNSLIASVPIAHDVPGKIAVTAASEHEGTLRMAPANIAIEK